MTRVWRADHRVFGPFEACGCLIENGVCPHLCLAGMTTAESLGRGPGKQLGARASRTKALTLFPLRLRLKLMLGPSILPPPRRPSSSVPHIYIRGFMKVSMTSRPCSTSSREQSSFWWHDANHHRISVELHHRESPVHSLHKTSIVLPSPTLSDWNHRVHF